MTMHVGGMREQDITLIEGLATTILSLIQTTRNAQDQLSAIHIKLADAGYIPSQHRGLGDFLRGIKREDNA